MSFLLDFWHYDFLAKALAVTLLITLSCGLISPLVIAKRFAFMGEAVSHSTLLGLAISTLFISTGHSFALFFSTLAITLVSVSALAYSSYKENIPSDGLIGLYLTATLALGILIYTSFGSTQMDLLSFLFGNILALTAQDVWLAAAMATLSLSFLLPFKKRWIFYLSDPQASEVAGLNTKAHHYGLILMLTIIIVSTVKLAGTLLVNAFLLIPGILAYKIAPNMRQVFVISCLFSCGSGVLGLILANQFNFPPGASLALTQVILLGIILAKAKLTAKKG